MPDNALRRFLARHDVMLTGLCRAGFALGVVTVAVLSLLPQDVMPKVELSDKVGHFIAYAAIAAAGLLGWRTAAAPVAIASILLGGALEIAQMFVPGRSAELLDFVVDAGGVAAGMLLAGFLLRFWTDTGARASRG